MKKENRPGQQAANNIDIRGSDVTPPAPPHKRHAAHRRSTAPASICYALA